MKIPLCKICEPAICPYRVDGQMSYIYLCGGNELNLKVARCPYRSVYVLPEVDPEANLTKTKE